MLTRDTFIGPWAGLPVAWTDDDKFDEQIYRQDVSRCCRAGVPGVYSGGTTGEFYAMEFDEFKAVARVTVEECQLHGKPVMIGCTCTYALGVARRAAFAAELGADAIQVALPFWMEVEDSRIVPFFKEVAATAQGLALSIYETMRAKKALSLDQHREIKDAVPDYLMVKSNNNTLGTTPEGCASLSEFVNVFVGEYLWDKLGPKGAKGSCSSIVYWNPRLLLQLWEQVQRKNWLVVQEGCRKLESFHEFLISQFGAKGFTDTAYDRLGGVATGFLKTSLRSRGPYPSADKEDVKIQRQWLKGNFPEMLEL